MTRRGPRDFDPARIGAAECDAWVAYYRRDWRGVLVGAVALVRGAFGMSWPRTIFGAWLVLRANQAWAPFPHNAPDLALARMRRFYVLVARDSGIAFDPERAAELEVRWWRVHRERQREQRHDASTLVDAITDLYAYVYGVDPDAVRSAAKHRVAAMDVSDRWVAAGRDTGDPRLITERAELITCYTSLLAGVQR